MTDPGPPPYEDLASIPAGWNPQTAPQPPPAAGPPPAPVPGPADLSLPRLAAALIDIALLTGLFLILALTIGHGSIGGGNVSISLYLGNFTLYLALVLLYFFAMEATTGQTIGKRLLGLRVLRADGTRPSAAAIAARTLLRIIDWLPLLYLTGCITMLATGQRRQRLGDLAARTAVARALPGRRRSPALIPLALVLAAVAGLSAYRASTYGNPQTYQAHGVSFSYPPGWQQGGSIRYAAGSSSGSAWTTVVGIDPLDVIIVAAFPATPPVTAANLPALTPVFTRELRRATQQGDTLAGPERITMGGMPALEFRGTRLTPYGTHMESTLIFAFDGTTVYRVACQYTPTTAARVAQACGQVMRTFKAG
jgi:uncharacterized RDD family membrane protein YckC